MDVREHGIGSVGQKACVAPKGCFFQVAQTWRTTPCGSETQRRTRHYHEFDTPWRSPQTQTTPSGPLSLRQNPKVGHDDDANGRKHHVKMRGPTLENRYIFALYNFPSVRSEFPNTCINHSAWLVDPWGVHSDSSTFKLSPKRVPKLRKRAHLRAEPKRPEPPDHAVYFSIRSEAVLLYTTLN